MTIPDDITERDCFFALSLDMLCIAGFDGYFKDLNPAWERTLGFTIEEIKAKPCIEFVHPEDQAATIAEAQKLITTGKEAVAFENRYLCKDGSYKWLSWRSMVSIEKQLYYAVARDITERNQAEAVLDQERHLLHTLMENIPDNIYFKDADSRFIRINKAMADWFGLSEPAQALGRTDFDFFASEHAQQAYEDEREVMRSGKPMIGRAEKETWRDGRETWVSTTKVPLRNEEAQIIGTFGISRDITEHKQAEEALRESEEKWRSLVENAPDAIMTLDLDYTIQFSNYILPGLTMEDVIGRSIYGLVSPEHHDNLRRSFERVIQTGEAASYEITWSMTGAWYAGRVGAIRRDGQIIGLVTIATNVTDRKQAEQALQESEERFHRAILSAPFPIMIHAEDGEVVLISRTWTELTGYAHQDISTISEWTERAYGQRQDLVKADIDRLYSLNERLKEAEYLITTSSGETRTWDFSSAPLGSLPDGRRLVISMAMDITDRVQAEKELTAKEALYRTLIESVPHLIWLGESDGQVTFLNRAWHELTGRPNEDSWGTGWAESLHPDDLPTVLAKWERAYKHSEPYHGECRFRASDGSYKTMTFIGTPVRDNSGEIINWVGINTDITERVQAEIELHTAKEEAEYANCAKSDFLANMSHELRTPLNAIIGFSEILRDEILGPINDEQKELVLDIHTSGNHLLVMINAILDLSKIEAGKMELQPETFSIAETMEEINTVIRALVNKKQIQLCLEFDQDILVEADKVKFKQILYNLLSNAIEFTRPGGKVTTEFGLSEDSVDGIGNQSNLLVRVIDTGVGIKPADRNKLFQPFTQLDASKSREHSGTGLGLALTHRLVELHGGKIWVESQYGHGSTFQFTLPLHREIPHSELSASQTRLTGSQDAAAVQVNALQHPTPHVSPPSSSSRTILVAEDNEQISQLLGIYLTEAGYQVEYAGDGEEAVVKAEKIRPFAITLDIMLPKKDGW